MAPVRTARQRNYVAANGSLAAAASDNSASDDNVVRVEIRARNAQVSEVKVVHRPVLVKASPYIRRRLEPINGVRQDSVALHPVDADTFQYFWEFAYRGRFEAYKPGPRGANDIFDQLIKLYSFAEMLEAYGLCDNALFVAAATGRRYGQLHVRPELLPLVYDRPVPPTGLRKFLVDVFVWHSNAKNPDFISRHVHRDAPSDFTYDVYRALTPKTGKQPTKKHVNPYYPFVAASYHYEAPEVLSDTDDEDDNDDSGVEEVEPGLFVTPGPT